MPRRLISQGGVPFKYKLLADFTQSGFPQPVATGAATASDNLVYDNFAANAANRSYTIDENGIGIHFIGATTGQVAHISYRPVTPFDLSSSDFIAIEYDVLEGEGDFGNILQIYLTTQTGTTYTNYSRKSINAASDKIPCRQISVVRFSETGWTLTSGGPTGWPNNMTSVGKIDFKVTVQATSSGGRSRTYIRKVWLGSSKSKVILSFDDAHQNQHDVAAPTLAAAGFKATLCASSGYINDANKLTDAMLSALYNTYGWDFGLQQTDDTPDIFLNRATTGVGLTRIGSTATWVNAVGVHLKNSGQFVTIHGCVDPLWNNTFGPITVLDTSSFTFPCAGTETTPATGFITCQRLSDQKIIDIIDFEREYYASRGFTRGNDFMAYSNGVVGEIVLAPIEAAGIVMGRSTNTGSSPMTRIFDPRAATPRSWLNLPASRLDQELAATILGHVDSAIQKGASIMIYGHNILPGVGTGTSATMDQAEFEAFVTGLKLRKDNGLIDVVTFTELLEDLNYRRATAYDRVIA